MNYINLTPHDINLNNGTKIPKDGKIAGLKEENGDWEGLIRKDKLTDVENLPSPVENTIYIVSMPTLLGLRAGGDNRQDVVCPITRGEGVQKNEKGWIISVPGFRIF